MLDEIFFKLCSKASASNSGPRKKGDPEQSSMHFPPLTVLANFKVAALSLRLWELLQFVLELGTDRRKPVNTSVSGRDLRGSPR